MVQVKLNRTLTKERLLREGRWRDFLTLKGNYQSGGLGARDAYVKALESFPPVVYEVGGVAVGAVVPSVIRRGDIYGPRVSEREAIKWVFEHVEVDMSLIDPSGVPGAGAWGLLAWVQSSASNRATFYGTMWPKILPSRGDLDRQSRQSDDGRSVLELIGRIEESIGKELSDGSERKESRSGSGGEGEGEESGDDEVGVT